MAGGKGPSRVVTIAVCGVLLVVFLALSVTSGLGKSPTADENRYAGFGKYLLATGDFRSAMFLDQPPLAHYLISAPFLAIETPPASGEVREQVYNSRLGRAFLLRNTLPVETVLLIGRSVVGVCGALLGLLLAMTAFRRYGGWGAIVVAAIFSFSPSFLAHSRLLTSDVIAALFLGLAAVAWASFLERPGGWRALLGGGSLGLALLAKVTGLLLLPALCLAAFVRLLREESGEKRSWLRRAVPWAGTALVIAGVVFWAGFGFDRGPVIPKDDAFLSKKLWLDHWTGSARTALTEVSVPAPAYARNIMYVGRHSNRGHACFMNGEVSKTGFLLFYPFILAVKLPVGTLLLLAATVVSFLFRRPDRFEGTLAIVVAVLFYFAIRSNAHLGIRTVLPAVALLFLLAGRLPGLVRGRVGKALIGICLVGNAVSTVLAFPHYLPYVNEAAGGSAGGYRLVADSNYDWGQDLPGLRAYVEEKGIGAIRLSYFGAIDPAEYGIRYGPVQTVEGMDELSDEELIRLNPGWVAISATNLQDLYSGKFGEMGWAKRFKPVARIGHTIFVYHLAAD